jgi:multiple sugar transport system ATP-binding protein
MNEDSTNGIVLEHVTKVFPGGVTAVDDVSLEIGEGEFMVLVGPSGCGKSTLLRMIAGLEEVSDGRIEIAGRDVTYMPPRDRDIAMVFQSYALYPHMTVRDNLAYGLRARRTAKAEVERRVNDAAAILGLRDLLSRRPGQLSGGQRQRVAMGRAIVREPAAFLMDEPLSNLDAKLRVDMRASLAQLHARLGVTTVYVTHDQVEAMTLGTRVAVLSEGRVQQVDTPHALYEAPRNLFVASFIGSPAMNLVEASIDDRTLRAGSLTLPLDAAVADQLEGMGRVAVGIRPELFEDAALAPDHLPRLDVEVAVVEDLGSDVHVIFRVDGARVPAGAQPRSDDDDEPALLGGDSTLFNARIDPRTQARAGAGLTLSVDPARFHFFDLESGNRLRLQRQAFDHDEQGAAR